MAGLHFKTNIGNLQPYGGAGVGVIVQNDLKIGMKQIYTGSSQNTSTLEQEMKLTNKIPFAYEGYIGFNIPINPRAAFFVQAKATLASFYITRTEITKYTIDGIDQLKSMPVRYKITEYEENKDYVEIGNGDPSKPQFGGAPYPFAANSIAFTMGISFSL